MKSLIRYTKDHFAREEQIMASVSFPHLERHKMGHALLAKQVKQLQQKYERGSITVASQLSTVLREWLSLHIRRSDKELKTFLKKMADDAHRHAKT